MPESKGRDLAESVAWRLWEKASREAPEERGSTLDGAAAAWVSWASTYYRRQDGSQTREAVNCEIGIRLLRSRFGRKPIDDLTHRDILDARDELVRAGLQRRTVNQRVGIWKRFFAWALDHRLCSASTKAEAWAVGGLKPHRSLAREGEPVRPVRHLDVKRTLPYLPPSLRAMVSIHELTGARPAEICAMRAADIDRKRDVWVYRPQMHKTQHKGLPRAICIGPRAQRILTPMLLRPGAIFSPAIAVAERRAELRRGRRTPVQPSQRDRSKEAPERAPGASWTAAAYAKAIAAACRRAISDGALREPWHPNQLRHACGTRVRRRFGPDAARSVLGHSAAGASRITDGYTREAVEREYIRASARAMRLIG